MSHRGDVQSRSSGIRDLLMLNDTNHGVAIRQMNGTQVELNLQVGTINAAGGWRYTESGDFNGDGRSDLLLLNDTNHGVATWQMNGTQVELNPQIGTINAAAGVGADRLEACRSQENSNPCGRPARAATRDA